MERRSWSPLIVGGMVLGAALGAIVALVMIRRRRSEGSMGLGAIPWRDLLTLLGPVVMLARRLTEISRRQMIELEKR